MLYVHSCPVNICIASKRVFAEYQWYAYNVTLILSPTPPSLHVDVRYCLLGRVKMRRVC